MRPPRLPRCKHRRNSADLNAGRNSTVSTRPLAGIEGSKLVPMAEIPDRLPELDREAETLVVCHHGLRSAYATQLLERSGFGEVLDLEGGLDAYSTVDPSVPRY